MMMRANARMLPRGSSATSEGDGALRCDRAGEDMLQAFWPSAADGVTLPAEMRGLADAARGRVAPEVRAAAARGLDEAVTWSFIAEAEAVMFGGGAWRVENPISEALKVMR